MAIIIPSSKNYGINNNDKVRNNVIDRIEFAGKNIKTKNEYSKLVHNEDFDVKELWNENWGSYDINVLDIFAKEEKGLSVDAYYSVGYYVRALGAGVKPIYKSLSFNIPKTQNDILVSRIQFGKNREGYNNIKSTVTSQFFYRNATPTLTRTTQGDTNTPATYEMSSLSVLPYMIDNTQKSVDLIELSTSFDLLGTVDTMPLLQLSFEEDKTDIGTARISYDEATDMYKVDFEILCGYIWFKVAFGKDFVFDDDVDNYTPIKCGYFGASGGYPTSISGNNAKGVVKYCKPLSINIAFYGNTIELNIADETLYINGISAEKVHKIEGNELTQTQSRSQKVDVDYTLGEAIQLPAGGYRVPVTILQTSPYDTYIGYLRQDGVGEHIVLKAGNQTANIIDPTGVPNVIRVYRLAQIIDVELLNTIEKYKNGVETATIRCSIGEYYDENDNVVISTKTATKMLFEHYDQVVPMIKTPLGYDKPMSLTSDGKAKVFEVVGTRQFYDGAVLQELTLRDTGLSVDWRKTTYRVYGNKAGGLTYEITSNQIEITENDAKGLTYTIGVTDGS
jgi:hypothetical protein